MKASRQTDSQIDEQIDRQKDGDFLTYFFFFFFLLLSFYFLVITSKTERYGFLSLFSYFNLFTS